MALQLERAREFGVMRALGLTPGRLKLMLAVQTGLMGFAAAILALPLGNILAYIFIFVINKRSFGWSLDYHFQPMQLLQAVIIAILASLLAGIVPGIKMSKSSPILALREE
jgi:putative ABC transport system permease protein